MGSDVRPVIEMKVGLPVKVIFENKGVITVADRVKPGVGGQHAPLRCQG